MKLLSKKASCNTHGQDSSYFLGWQEYEKDPYDEVRNPKGIIQMGLAENQLVKEMASTTSQTRELGDSNEFRGSHLETRIADDIHVNIPRQPNADDPNDQVRRDVQRITDDIRANIPHQPNAHDPNDQVRRDAQRSPPWFLVHSALMQIEAAIIQVHCQGSSPFKTDPLKMWTLLIAMFTHYGAALYYGKGWLTGSGSSKICDQIGYISGSLAFAAFLSILVPPSLVPLIFVIWMFHLPLYFDDARDRILNVVQQLYRYFSNN